MCGFLGRSGKNGVCEGGSSAKEAQHRGGGSLGNTRGMGGFWLLLRQGQGGIKCIRACALAWGWGSQGRGENGQLIAGQEAGRGPRCGEKSKGGDWCYLPRKWLDLCGRGERGRNVRESRHEESGSVFMLRREIQMNGWGRIPEFGSVLCDNREGIALLNWKCWESEQR